VAWWLWAIGLATAASQTTNPLLLLLVFAVLGTTVATCRSQAPWARAFKYYLWVAAVVLLIRVVFRSVFGGDVTTVDAHVLFRLPSVPLPHWAAGIQLGGPVTLEGTAGALYDGLRLGCLLACLGAANALANPKRALRVLPGALYELGVAVVVSLSVASQLVESAQRVRRARRLRGDAGRGRRALRAVVIPVLEDALERSLRLAAAMDSRGYGRTGAASAKTRRLTGALMVAGMVGLCVGAYGLLDGSTIGEAALPGLVGGAALAGAGLLLGGRRVRRSQYRPDRWRAPEWWVMAAGLLPAAVLIARIGVSPLGLNPSVYPIAWPTLPLWPAVAILLATLPVLAAPPPIRSAPSRPTLTGPTNEPSDLAPGHDGTRPEPNATVPA
jgi:energy-coupling factor transport system permease protein